MKNLLTQLPIFLESGECLLDLHPEDAATEWVDILAGKSDPSLRYVRVSDLIRLLERGVA